MDQDSQDQVEAAQALADGLIVRDLLMNIELVEARVQAVKFLGDYGMQERDPSFPEGGGMGILGVRSHQQVLDVLDVQSNYFRRVEVDGIAKRVPDYEQNTVKEIQTKFGTEAMEDFLRACLEQAEVGSSAGYMIQMAWNADKNRQATLGETISCAKAHCDALTRKNRQLTSDNQELKSDNWKLKSANRELKRKCRSIEINRKE